MALTQVRLLVLSIPLDSGAWGRQYFWSHQRMQGSLLCALNLPPAYNGPGSARVTSSTAPSPLKAVGAARAREQRTANGTRKLTICISAAFRWKLGAVLYMSSRYQVALYSGSLSRALFMSRRRAEARIDRRCYRETRARLRFKPIGAGCITVCALRRPWREKACE